MLLRINGNFDKVILDENDFLYEPKDGKYTKPVLEVIIGESVWYREDDDDEEEEYE